MLDWACFGNPINGGPKFLYHVKHGTSSRVSRVSAMVSVGFSRMFNMVQEFGTAVYRIAHVFVSFFLFMGACFV